MNILQIHNHPEVVKSLICKVFVIKIKKIRKLGTMSALVQNLGTTTKLMKISRRKHTCMCRHACMCVYWEEA